MKKSTSAVSERMHEEKRGEVRARKGGGKRHPKVRGKVGRMFNRGANEKEGREARLGKTGRTILRWMAMKEKGDSYYWSAPGIKNHQKDVYGGAEENGFFLGNKKRARKREGSPIGGGRVI